MDTNAFGMMQDSAVDVNQALFQPFPPEIIFQHYEPHQMYEIPISLHNLDVVTRSIKVTIKDSPYFSMVGKTSSGTKVAPGMEVTSTIRFVPDQQKVSFFLPSLPNSLSNNALRQTLT